LKEHFPFNIEGEEAMKTAFQEVTEKARRIATTSGMDAGRNMWQWEGTTSMSLDSKICHDDDDDDDDYFIYHSSIHSGTAFGYRTSQ
jgi:hypothetical protein